MVFTVPATTKSRAIKTQRQMKKALLVLVACMSVICTVYAQQDDQKTIKEKAKVILDEMVQPAISQQQAPDWNSLHKSIGEKYNRYYADRLVTVGKLYYYFNRDWPEFTRNITLFTEKYVPDSSSKDLNANASYVAQYSSDKSELKKAYSWIKKAVRNDPENKEYKKTFEQLQALVENKGIRFEDGLSWAMIKTKAKKEHKYIFVDCYTTWCGPCRFMTRNIFPLSKVSHFVNDKFISVSVQMDTTKKDSKEIRTWYADASKMAGDYQINVYPSFLIFNEDGKPVHKIIGSVEDGDAFISKLNDAFDEKKQYYTLIGGFKQHLQDSAYLADAVNAAARVQDFDNVSSIGDVYLQSIKNPFLKNNLRFLGGTIVSGRSKTFRFFIDHAGQVDTCLGVGSTEKILRPIIQQEEVGPFVKSGDHTDWTGLAEKLKNKYPELGSRAVLFSRLEYYQGHYQGPAEAAAYISAITDFMYAEPALTGGYMDSWNNTSDAGCNRSAWAIFELSDDKEQLIKALGWSKKTILSGKAPGIYMDTYANLLYKLGRKNEAIAWENKALSAAASPDDKNDFTRTLGKMQNGEKTWDPATPNL